MRSRRAFIATGTAVAIGGCLGGLGEDPYYTVDVRTVDRDDGALIPSIAVADPNVSTESAATVEVTLQNRSFQRVGFTVRPNDSRWLGAVYSANGNVALPHPDNVVRNASNGSEPCWREDERVGIRMAAGAIHDIWPWIPEVRRYSVVARHDADCLSPGTYRFQSSNLTDGSADDVEWVFEIEVREA